MKILTELANNLEKRWRKYDYHPDELANLAFEALSEARLNETLDFKRALHHYALNPAGVTHGSFSVVPIFKNDYFYVHFHLWFDPIADPHDHSWGGAVYILEGKVLSGKYQFKPQEKLSGGAETGELSLQNIEIQTPGFCYAIPPGPKFIHSLAYVSRPGCSISIRAKKITEKGRTYHKGGGSILTSPKKNPALVNQEKILSFLYETDPDHFLIAFEDVLKKIDAQSAIHLMSQFYGDGQGVAKRLEKSFINVFGKKREILISALPEMEKTRKITELRAEYHDEVMRFFLGALFICHTPKDIFELTKRFYPDQNPVELAGKCLAELLVSAEGIEIPAGIYKGLGKLVEGSKPDKILTELKAEFKPDELKPDHLNFLNGTFEEMKKVALYSPLFA